MHLQSSYPNHSSSTITLDTICNSALFFSAKWEPSLKRNQSPYLLIHLINKLYGGRRGSLFHARIRASHASLAAHLQLSREWICHLVGVLRDSGWITTESPRLPDGKQEITTFRLGKTFKRLLVMLIKSREHSRVNTSSQKTPTKADVEKNRALLATLIAELGQKFTPKKAGTG